MNQLLVVSAPVFVTAVSGLAYLAVKHPRIYLKLFGKVYFISSLAFLIMVVWSGAFSWAHATLLPYITSEKLGEARAAVEALSIPVPWLILTNLLIIGYLFFLSWLAHQVDQDKHAGEDDA